VANAVGQSTRDDQTDRVRQQAGSYRFGGVCQPLRSSLANNVLSINADRLAARLNVGNRPGGTPLIDFVARP
jgi:hypothetical protein